MSYNFQKWYYTILFTLFLACAPDADITENFTFTPDRLMIAGEEGLRFENSQITDGNQFNFKTQTAGTYTLEIRNHYNLLTSKSTLNAKIGDNVYSFYTRALKDGDYSVIILSGKTVVHSKKLTIQ
tara:strand:- start:8322 stop:8699 length:378 start_codon:yes stop_codon:yes gene_type:complete